jgi:hypothetical protein
MIVVENFSSKAFSVGPGIDWPEEMQQRKWRPMLTGSGAVGLS